MSKRSGSGKTPGRGARRRTRASASGPCGSACRAARSRAPRSAAGHRAPPKPKRRISFTAFGISERSARSRSSCSGCSSKVAIARPGRRSRSSRCRRRSARRRVMTISSSLRRRRGRCARTRSVIRSSRGARAALVAPARAPSRRARGRPRSPRCFASSVGEREEAADGVLRELAEAHLVVAGRDAGDAADHGVRDRIAERRHQVDHAARGRAAARRSARPPRAPAPRSA